jgi:DNA-binding CsgD family transcriptional regulator
VKGRGHSPAVLRLGPDLLVIRRPKRGLPPDARAERWARLSPAERECLAFVRAGHSASVTAALRSCSERTVSNLVGRAYAKLEVSGRIEFLAQYDGLFDQLEPPPGSKTS